MQRTTMPFYTESFQTQEFTIIPFYTESCQTWVSSKTQEVTTISKVAKHKNLQPYQTQEFTTIPFYTKSCQMWVSSKTQEVSTFWISLQTM